MTWISVEDRLPDIETDVLTCTRDHYIWVNQLWDWDAGTHKWYNNNRFTDFEDITHWQPLPEPTHDKTIEVKVDLAAQLAEKTGLSKEKLAEFLADKFMRVICALLEQPRT